MVPSLNMHLATAAIRSTGHNALAEQFAQNPLLRGAIADLVVPVLDQRDRRLAVLVRLAADRTYFRDRLLAVA